MFLVEVLNANQEGVSGKVPSSVSVSKKSDTGATIEIYVNTSSSDFGMSGSDGIMVVPVKILCMGQDSLSVKITISVDGLSVESEYIQLSK